MTDTAPDPIIVKKYANRRLYNTGTSSYITLEHLAAMTREGRDFKVIDAKTGEDITGSVLTQIIMEEEQRGPTMLPVNFLRQLISMYGDSMQSMVPHYLEESMESFRRNQEQFREAMAGAFKGGPFEALAKRNMEVFENATRAFTEGSRQAAATAAPPAAGGAESQAEELRALKEQMAQLQEKLEKLAK